MYKQKLDINVDSEYNKNKSFCSSKTSLNFEEERISKEINNIKEKSIIRYSILNQKKKDKNLKALMPKLMNIISFINNINNQINISSIESSSTVNINNHNNLDVNHNNFYFNQKINKLIYSSINNLRKNEHILELNNIDNINKDKDENDSENNKSIFQNNNNIYENNENEYK